MSKSREYVCEICKTKSPEYEECGWLLCDDCYEYWQDWLSERNELVAASYTSQELFQFFVDAYAD